MTLSLDPVTGYLPLEIHHMLWHDMVESFGFNGHGLRLIEGLRAACENLQVAGCS